MSGHKKRSIIDIPAGYNAVVVFHGPEGGTIVALQGESSVFTSPLRLNVRYHFKQGSLPVASRGGGRIDVVGGVVKAVQPADSSIDEIHMILQDRRRAVTTSGRDTSGPRVLVAGGTDTGKSSLCRTLINLAVTADPTPATRGGDVEAEGGAAVQNAIAYCDFDLGQNGISCPGTVAAVFPEDPLPVEEPFDGLMPLCFYYGELSLPGGGLERYVDLANRTCRCVDALQSNDLGFKQGGCIVNTMGWTKGLGLEAICRLVDALRITHVIVTGTDVDLRDAIRDKVQKATTNIHFFIYRSPKGIQTRTGIVRRNTRSAMISRYFCGTHRSPLVPARIVVPRRQLHFVDPATNKALEEIPPPLTLCAVSFAHSLEQVSEANVAGFVVLLDIGEEAVSLLSPSPSALPGAGFLVASSTIKIKPEDVPPL